MVGLGLTTFSWPWKKSFRILIVGASNAKDGCSSNDICYAKLRLVSTVPTHLKSFPLTYSFGILNADGGIDFKTEALKAKSSDLITIAGNKTELFTKSKLMANKNQVVINEAVTFVCQVKRKDFFSWIIQLIIDFRLTSKTLQMGARRTKKRISQII